MYVSRITCDRSVDAYEQKYGTSVTVPKPTMTHGDEPDKDVSIATIQHSYQDFLREASRIQREKILETHPEGFHLRLQNLQAQVAGLVASSSSVIGNEEVSTTASAATSTTPSGRRNLSFVTLVGTGIAKSRTLLPKLRSRLRKHGIPNSIPHNIRKSEDSICVVVDSADCKRAVHALHLEFVGGFPILS